MREVIINENDANQRLDKFLTKYLVNMPQNMLYKSLRKECVRVNGKHVKDGKYMLKNGDILKLFVKDEFFADTPSFNVGRFDIDVIYEDENIILINKPSGLVVHSDDKGTSDTLLDRMKSYLYKKGEYNPCNEHSFSPSLCNRIDRNTSGIIIGAKNATSLRIINEKLRTREICKLYLCIVDGTLDGSDKLSSYLTRGDKIVSVNDKQTDGAKKIITKYTSLAIKNNKSLLEIELETGRTHQIRAQLAHIGHSLCGDTKYGSQTKCDMCLASYKLVFAFKTDAGKLNYLKNKTFSISVPFAENMMK